MGDEESTDQTVESEISSSSDADSLRDTPEEDGSEAANGGGSVLLEVDSSDDAGSSSPSEDPLSRAQNDSSYQPISEPPAEGTRKDEDPPPMEQPVSVSRTTDSSAYDDLATQDSAASTLGTRTDRGSRQLIGNRSPTVSLELPPYERADGAVDASEATAPTHQYECLDCGRRCETFLDDCPACGATAFKNDAMAPEVDERLGTVNAGYGVVATVTARFNPYVPR